MKREEIIKAICRVFDVDMLGFYTNNTQSYHKAHSLYLHLVPAFSETRLNELIKEISVSKVYANDRRKECVSLMKLDSDFRDKYYAIQDYCYLKGLL